MLTSTQHTVYYTVSLRIQCTYMNTDYNGYEGILENAHVTLTIFYLPIADDKVEGLLCAVCFVLPIP